MEIDDPNRDVYLKGLTLRNALNLGIVGLGVADMAIALGAVTIVLGFGARGGTGGGLKPVAAIVINKNGVKVEPVAGPPSVLQKVGAAIGTALQKHSEKSES